MPVHIDHMETSVEITQSAAASEGAAGAGSRPSRGATTTSEGRAALASAVGQVLASELERFLKTRGM